MILKFAFFALYPIMLLAENLTTLTAPQPIKHLENLTTFGEIYDIKTSVILDDKGILQLAIDWKDTLPKDTSYNVILTSMNLTECPDMPCSVFGVQKPEKTLIIPESPMSIVDIMECNFMFGCNYTLLVETSNTIISNMTTVEIPYCIMDTCSCRHAVALPKVQTAVNIPRNDTINLNWSVKLNSNGRISKHNKNNSNTSKNDINEFYGKKNKLPDVMTQDIEALKIHLKVNKQTNPSLSWGGKVSSIVEEIYNLSQLSYNITRHNLMQGNIKIKVDEELTDEAVLNLHTALIDALNCAGPANVVKVKVPTFNDSGAAVAEVDINLRNALIIVTFLFLLLIAVLVFVLYICRRRRQKAHAQMKKDELYLSSFPTIVEMEDNINYVDKYVEEAQSKGLADMFEVPHTAIQIGPEIGEGAFGRVYKATAINLYRMRGATVVAVKQLKKNPTSEEIGEFQGEIEMLKNVGIHENIVCFLGCCTIRPPYLIIMEYVGRGDLLSYLRQVRYETGKFRPKNANHVKSRPSAILTPTNPAVKYIELKISSQSIDSEAELETRQPHPSFAETTYTIIGDEPYKEETFEYILDHKELHNFALQIANGMRFLEEQDVVHRDLAARNVLIDDHKTLKISDFGLSRHGIYTNTKTRKLPLRWLSIEAIRDNIYSSKSDVWAYGVVLWEIGTLGASPYPTISNNELIPFLLEGKRLDKPEVCTDQVYDIMLQCWHEDPGQRPGFEQLYKMLSPKTAYVDINSLSDDYVFPPIKENV